MAEIPILVCGLVFNAIVQWVTALLGRAEGAVMFLYFKKKFGV